MCWLLRGINIWGSMHNDKIVKSEHKKLGNEFMKTLPLYMNIRQKQELMSQNKGTVQVEALGRPQISGLP